MGFPTKNPIGGVESRKSASGNDKRDKASANLRDGGRGRDTGLKTGGDTGYSAAEYAKKYSGEATKENSWTGKGGGFKDCGVK